VARGDQEDLVLNDTTRYRGSNQAVLQADLDRGKQGIAEVKHGLMELPGQFLGQRSEA
jgi:hypothetical protein